MSQPERAPRTRSAFAAAFLSLLFPGLGHAYAGAYARGLGFAAAPLLLLALTGGIALRADRAELLGFFAQESVLQAMFILNVGALLYRIIAAVDAWNVTRFLNDAAMPGRVRAGRAGIVGTPLGVLSVAGLIAVVFVIGGAHLVAARYNALALELVQCVFTEDADPSCESPEDSPEPADSPEPVESEAPGASPLPTPSEDAVPSPEGTAGTGTPAPTLPPWDGKERLNVLLVGVDQRPGEGTFNTDTLIVASVEPETGQVAMFQVPRDMVDVPVPANARSVWGSVYRGKVNSWFMQNRQRSDLWPGRNDTARGFNSLKALLGELYDLDIRYYVMVNFQGFRKVVNTMGGVQVNVQMPVYESTYPAGDGALRRIYIPAGPQHMTGSEALIFARSRHRSTDFDRGRRQQRVILSLREQMNAQAILANLSELVDDLKDSIKTDVKTGDLPELLALADSVNTQDVRSFVFSPSFYATEFLQSDRGYIITPNVARIRKAVAEAFKVTPAQLARRERLESEAASVWVLNGSGRGGLQNTTAEYLEYQGLDASAPNRRVETRPATTEIVVYNGAEADLPETIEYLERRFKTTVTTATDPDQPIDIVITLGKDAPNLEIEAVG